MQNTLSGVQEIVVFTMVHDSAGYSMLHYFAVDTGTVRDIGL